MIRGGSCGIVPDFPQSLSSCEVFLVQGMESHGGCEIFLKPTVFVTSDLSASKGALRVFIRQICRRYIIHYCTYRTYFGEKTLFFFSENLEKPGKKFKRSESCLKSWIIFQHEFVTYPPGPHYTNYLDSEPHICCSSIHIYATKDQGIMMMKC